MSTHLFDIFGRFEQISVERRALVNVVKMDIAKAVPKDVSAILPLLSAFFL